jgi:MoxR-like ATPase
MVMKTGENVAMDDRSSLRAEKAFPGEIAVIRKEVGKVIFGQESVVEQTLFVPSLSSAVGVPGLAKTKPVLTLAVLGLNAAVNPVHAR